MTCKVRKHWQNTMFSHIYTRSATSLLYMNNFHHIICLKLKSISQMLSPYCRTAIITDNYSSFPQIVYVFKACLSLHFASWWNQKPGIRLTDQVERTLDSPRKASLWLNREQQLTLTWCTPFYVPDNRHSSLGLPWEGSNLLNLTQSLFPLKFLQFLGLQFFSCSLFLLVPWCSWILCWLHSLTPMPTCPCDPFIFTCLMIALYETFTSTTYSFTRLYFIFKGDLFLFILMCLCVYHNMGVDAFGGQGSTSDPPELEL